MLTSTTHTCAVLRCMLAAAFLSIASASQAQQIDYILDTGVGSFNIGPAGFDANVTWINSFDTIEGGEMITQVSVSYGDIEDNSGNIGSDAVTTAILSDPNNDHDPSDAMVLSITNALWQDTGFGEFVTYQVEPTEVQDVFFVAIVMDALDRATPASMDSNAPTAGTQSWLFYNPELNLDDLGSSPFSLHMSESAFHGAWMVRATGEPASQCLADVNGDGQLNFFDVSVFLAAFGNQDPVADFDSNGNFNFFDVSAFLAAFAMGCP